MGNQLIPKQLFSRGLFPFSRFPRSLLEDFEDQFSWGEQSGLTLSEDETHVFVEAQMPGLKAEDINVTLENGVLKIFGERKEEQQDKGKKYYHKASYAFNYQLSLPGQVDESDPKAVYKDGVMKITFNKTKEGKGKKISVKGA